MAVQLVSDDIEAECVMAGRKPALGCIAGVPCHDDHPSQVLCRGILLYLFQRVYDILYLVEDTLACLLVYFRPLLSPLLSGKAFLWDRVSPPEPSVGCL